jgi:glycosyltransferase involved in cell wall biosynthesis
MIILSDCMTEHADEGCLNVANQLTARLKKRAPGAVTIISYGRRSSASDCHIKLNKLFFSNTLKDLIQSKKEPVLYIPFSSNTAASVFRLFVLSCYRPAKLSVLFTLRNPMNRLSRFLLRKSQADIFALSQESGDYYRNAGCRRVHYIRTGVNTKKFIPVCPEKKAELRHKYKIPEQAQVVLHVGHLKEGRNVGKLLCVEERYHVVFVSSTTTQPDEKLKKRLEQRPNTTVITHYVENVEELYQLADVYFFPVQQERNCIDVPLSVLEAAACGIPVVATAYGELRRFVNQPGIWFLEKLDQKTINTMIQTAIDKKVFLNTQVVGEYDWDCSIELLARAVEQID